MKIRYGFVSNSSSSSFIISIKDSKPCKHCGRNDPNILDLIEKYSSEASETYIEATELNSIISRIKNWYYDAKTLKELENKIKNEAKEGNKLALLNISYYNDTLRDLLNNKNIKILYKDNE